MRKCHPRGDYQSSKIKYADLIGKKIHLLTVISDIGKDSNGDAWVLCKCDCGNDYQVRRHHLLQGNVKSCGCLKNHSDWKTNYKINELTGCWEWSGARLKTGYGFAKRKCHIKKKKKNYLAHRLFYEHYKGEIPEGYFVCHKCDNPPCVNPLHLFIGKSIDNAQDKVNKGRQLKGETHPSHILTEMQVIEIRRQYENGISINTLAKICGVSCGTIQSVIRRKSWKHVICGFSLEDSERMQSLKKND